MIPRKQNMMRRMLKRAARARGEHGIALLFTLCILSMALITAMILSSESSTSRKVAAVHVDSSAARILADGAVGRAILGLMHSDSSFAFSNYNTNHPKNGKFKEYASDWIWKLEKTGVYTFDNGPIRFNKTTYYDLAEARCPSWEYVFDFPYEGGTATKNERIFGRYAYVAIGQSDQLNPNALGRRSSSYEPNFDASIYAKRLGRYTSEPQFVFKSVNGWDYSEKTPVISPLSITTKYNSTGGSGWSEQDLFDDAMAGSSADSKSVKMMLNQYFDVAGKPEYNKFSPTAKAVSALSKFERVDDEMYRFPLIRTDWNSIDVGSVRAAIPWFGNSSNAAVNQTVANLINYNATFDREAVSDRTWRSTDDPTYTGNKRTPYINEVAAEIAVGGHLGFRVPRKFPVGDPASAVWKWAIKYTDCSYSHDITVHVETVNMFRGIGGTDGYSAYPVGTPILFGGEISYEYLVQDTNNTAPAQGNSKWKKVSVPFEKISTDPEIVPTKNGDDNGYQDYVFIVNSGPIDSLTTPELDNNGAGYDKPIGHDADFYKYMRIRNVKVSLDRIILLDANGRNADLSLMPDVMRTGKTFCGDGSDSGEGEEACGLGDFRKRFYLHAQVNDPRFNLGRDQWSDSASLFISDSFLADTINARNDGAINLGSNYDREDRDDPVYNASKPISTAYIRHGQMISLWELGAIHRGYPWQTINLKCAVRDATTMAEYEKGDGHLLDQIALATSTDRAEDKVIGMINLNCVAAAGNAPFTFRSLFTGFPIYQTFENMNKSEIQSTLEGKSVDSLDGDADIYAAELAAGASYASENKFAPRRTAVFPETFPAGSANPMTHIIPQGVPDARSEEIFCRVVNLLKWNKEQTRRATILVLAQTIQDTGSLSGTVTLEKILPKSDTDLLREAGFQVFSDSSNKKRTTDMSVSDVRGNSGSMTNYYKRDVSYKAYDNFYDQITGEAKLIVHMEWDESADNGNGAWKITRKEYAE